MYYNTKDMETLAEFILICYKCDNVYFQDLVRKISNYKMQKISDTTQNNQISERFYIAQVLSFMNISFLYYEGIKKSFNCTTFLSYLDKNILLFMFDLDKKSKVLKKELPDNSKDTKCLGVVEKELEEYCLTVGGHKYILNKKQLKKIYMQGGKTITNVCFVADKVKKNHFLTECMKKIDYESCILENSVKNEKRTYQLQEIKMLANRWLDNEENRKNN